MADASKPAQIELPPKLFMEGGQQRARCGSF